LTAARQRVGCWANARAAACLTVALVPAIALTALYAGPAAAAEPIGGPRLGSARIIVAPGVTPPPDVADSWLVADLDSGKILAAKAPHVLKRPASTLKTLTAVTLLPVLDKAANYVAVDADVRAEGTRVGMIEKTSYTVDDLWKALLLVSANDAAHALGEVAGGQAKATAAMRTEARTLQALDTTVANTSGLDAKRQFSSAYDLALFGRAGMKMPEFRQYVGLAHSDFPGKPIKGAAAGTPRPRIPIETKNRLLLDGYPGIIGIKTGYTTLAGNTYIGAQTAGGHTVIITMMHTHQRLEPSAKALFSWAFHHLNAPGVGTLVDPIAPVAATSGGTTVRQPAAQGPTTPAAAGAPLPFGPIALVALGAGVLGASTLSLSRRGRRRRARVSPLGLPPLRR